jgi:hypothetical protein
MLSRAPITATVMLLIGSFVAMPVRAENLEAGKSPSQIFTSTCLACHKGMHGLVKTVAPGSLPGFLRQHYTTSPEMAGQLSTYLLSNGAIDTRTGGGSSKQGKDAKSEPKPTAAPEPPEPRLGHRQRHAAPQEAEKPDTDGQTVQGGPKGEPNGEPAPRPLRHAKRLARPGPDTPEADKPTAEGQPGAAAASEAGPGGRPLSARQKLSRRGRPSREEQPKTEAAKTDAAKTGARTEPGKEEPPKGEAAKVETPKDEPAKANATKGEASGSDTSLRADPVPAVTPAPQSSEGETRPTQTTTPARTSAASTASVSPASGHASEPSAAPAPAVGPAPPSMETAAPPAAPVGPPAPPISQ